MNKPIKVDDIKQVKTDRYSEGTTFMSGKNLYILLDNELLQVNLKKVK